MESSAAQLGVLMNKDEHGNRDEALSKVLKEWRVKATLPPRFQETVWHRIERLQPTPSIWDAISRWITVAVPRPAFAVSYSLALLIIATTAGLAQARQATARVKDQLGDRYVQVLDPYRTRRQ